MDEWQSSDKRPTHTRQARSVQTQVTGYADRSGSSGYNQQISEGGSDFPTES
jgi:outer membrane protein OmpA-like peptidoglycan-associated protein